MPIEYISHQYNRLVDQLNPDYYEAYVSWYALWRTKVSEDTPMDSLDIIGLYDSI